ncbi:ABC transporter permease [Nonomuraea sp. NPDC048826]|uniref:ABC transporter permease n=1 Tax=Nonomuraea sp. NPDC048826 TaxID=3364347 RepID=UPI003712396F
MRRVPWLGLIVVAMTVLFLAAPVVFVVINSFNASQVSQFPPQSWSLRWYEEALTDETLIDALVLSLRIAVVAASLSTVGGLCAAYALTRRSFPGRQLVHSLINLPVSLPRIAVGLAGLISYLTLAGSFASMGVVDGQGWLILMHAAITLPIVVGLGVSALEAQNQQLESASRDLGVGPVRTFLKVVLPLILPTVLVTFAFTFMISFDELESSLFMASESGNTLPVIMFIILETRLDPALAALSSAMLAAIVVAVVIGWSFLRFLSRTRLPEQES